MVNKILIITDNSKGRWLSSLRPEILDDSVEVSVLTLGLNRDYFMQSNANKPPLLNRCNFIDISSISEKIQASVRGFYINFIFELPNKVQKGLFSCKDKNLLWFLYISEKCTFESKIVNRLFSLELARSVMENNFYKIYLDLDDYFVTSVLLDWKPDKIKDIRYGRFLRYINVICDSTLFFTVKYIKNSLAMFLMTILRAIVLRINGITGIKPPERDGLFIFTNYPSWWNGLDTDNPSEKFFGTLHKYLMKDYKVFYAALLFPLRPYTVFFERSFLKRFFERNNIFLLESLLSIKQKAKILVYSYFHWALAVRNYFKTSFKSLYGEFDISKLVYQEIRYSLLQVELFKNILIEEIFDKFTEKFSPQALIYRLEFNPSEKAMLSGINKRCTTVAFQHSALSKNLLSHFFASGEIISHLNKNNSRLAMPLPDIIFTTGTYFRDIMIAAGFPKQKIDICGPVRYRALISYLKEDRQKYQMRQRLGFSDSEKIFLVAMNWVEKEGMALVSSLVEAAKDMGQGLRIILRSHPHSRYDKKISLFLERAKPNFKYFFLNDEFSLYDAIFVSDGVIQVFTTLGYEAMAIGRMPIVYENRHVFNVNSSEDLKKCAYISCSSDGLKEAMRLLADGDKRNASMMHEWQGVLEQFFYDFENDPYVRFTELLKRHGVLS